TYTDRVDADMSTLYISPQIESLLGITVEEYLAEPDLWERHLHPEDRVRAREEYLRGRDAGEPFTYEYRMIARHGRMVWFRDVAARLRSATRETDLVARQGGDEFMMLLSDLERGQPVVGDPAEHAAAVAFSVAARVHEVLLSPFTLGETELFVTASIGISVYP